VPQELVDVMAVYGTGLISTGFIIALAFLVIGMFIDAIPAIIILGTILYPLADKVGMHPIHFAIIGVISLAFGLVTPPYGLCLLISCSLGDIKMVDAIRDVTIILVPLLVLLMLVIVFPELILFLPRWLTPEFL
jgi:TRAP-type C4-dicarboxylate transport system permease large subunit